MSWPTIRGFGKKSPPEVTMLLRNYQGMKTGRTDFFYITGVTPQVVKGLLKGDPLASPNDRQNDSPTVAEMIALAEKHNGTLGGYVIPVESGRDDARVSFDTLFLNIGESAARKVKNIYKPDEFSKTKLGWRLWWD